MTGEEFLSEVILSGQPGESMTVKYATVSGILADGTAQLTFAGEGSASGKGYAFLGWYTPEAGDKVALLKYGRTYLMLGRITYGEPAPVSVTASGISMDDLPAGAGTSDIVTAFNGLLSALRASKAIGG